jgi:hypothetical protein
MTTWARRSGVSASWRCNRSLTEGSAGHEFYGVLSEQVVSRYAVDMGDHRVQIDVWSRLRFLPIFTKDPISALANTDAGLKHEGTRVAGSSQGDAWGCPKTTPWNLAAHHGAGQGDSRRCRKPSRPLSGRWRFLGPARGREPSARRRTAFVLPRRQHGKVLLAFRRCGGQCR